MMAAVIGVPIVPAASLPRRPRPGDKSHRKRSASGFGGLYVQRCRVAKLWESRVLLASWRLTMTGGCRWQTGF
ncbi:hypothetical protein SKAU_G00298760 [Synaphobranchus kaupii]|uniref:Uncharacterized protein n=1 Tax=Synaphobranchus kaupii TaxID=118154 RepID=A0A9Q1EVB8_SYNKA|nr:hypothetical protein SKAU_G00298760 [Synaphobranchus kaupii]